MVQIGVGGYVVGRSGEKIMREYKKMIKKILALYLLLFSATVSATEFNNNFKHKFWTKIYSDGGNTLYCKSVFTDKDRDKPGNAIPKLSLEHVYTAKQMMDFIGCSPRIECRRTSELFNKLETDPYNLWPATDHANKVRGDHPFGEYPDDHPEVANCANYDKEMRKFIPVEHSRGEIARSILHIYEKWHAPLDNDQVNLMLKWNDEYPVTEEERRRNEVIYKVFGTRNEWIDL
ncbi:MAG: endonuclease [Sedimenticola sp.]